MIYHIELIRIKKGTSVENIDNFYSGVQSLRSINGVLSVQCGPNEKFDPIDKDDKSDFYTHSILIVLRDKFALKRIQNSPLYSLLRKNIIKPLIDKDVSCTNLSWVGALKEDNHYLNLLSKFTPLNLTLFLGSVLGVLILGVKTRQMFR